MSEVLTENNSSIVVDEAAQAHEAQMKQLEALVFNEAMPGAVVPPVTEAQPDPPPVAEMAPPSVIVPPPAEDVVDEITYLKQQVGYEDWGKLKSDLDLLRKLQETPALVPEFKSEEAKRMYEYLQEERYDEVHDSLAGRKMVKGLDSMSGEQKIKLYFKMQNPLFDQEMIDYKYDQTYKLNEEDYADDPMRLRYEKISRLQKMEIDLQDANKFFEQYKNKIELPEIQKPAVQQAVDQDYETYKASIANEVELYNSTIKPALLAVKDTDVQFPVSVNDADNQMQFDLSIAVDPESFRVAQQKALAFNDYLAGITSDTAGNFTPQKVMRLILLEENFDKYAQSIARQAVNAERKRVLQKDTPTSSAQRTYSNIEKTDLQKLEDKVFGV